MSVRGIRGAIQIAGNEKELIHAGVKELLLAILEANELTPDDVISVLFTATPDLTADFPAVAAREIGFGGVPLMCAVEISVPGALPLVIRTMLHVESDKRANEVAHIYLHGAKALRRDIAQ